MSGMPPDRDPDAAKRFRVNLVRVMSVQVVTLVLLWLLQRHFTA
jgi:hypothetical protein